MESRNGLVERAFGVIKTLNLTNILILFLIVLIAIPAYFAYRFMADDKFRREFMSSAVILERYVPCTVLEGHRYGAQTRHSVIVAYAVMDGRIEKLIGMRSPDPLTDAQLVDMCKQVLALADKARNSFLEERDRSTSR